MARKKTPAQSGLIPQPHGGALRGGGPNGGGPGRPSNEVKALCRENFKTLIPKLVSIANRTKGVKTADVIRAIDVLGKYGTDPSVRTADVKQCLREQTEVIREVLPAEQAGLLLERLRGIWLTL